MAYEQQTAERVRKVLSRRRDVEEKKLMGGLCFMVGGGMCCSVSGRGGLLVRVDPQAHEHMLREAHVQPMEMGGRTMKGFVRVAPEGYRTDASLRTWIERGLAFLATQPAKSSAKRRKAPARRTTRGAK
jgi:TfoX/Sxy family transcriptional regulator of competence genes